MLLLLLTLINRITETNQSGAPALSLGMYSYWQNHGLIDCEVSLYKTRETVTLNYRRQSQGPRRHEGCELGNFLV